MTLDFSSALAARASFAPASLPVRTMAARITVLLEEAGEYSATADLTYNLACRSLSGAGVHTGLSTLDSYVTGRDGWFWRIAEQPETPNGALGSSWVALVLTSHLAQRVLDAEHEAGLLPTADKVMTTAAEQGASPNVHERAQTRHVTSSRGR